MILRFKRSLQLFSSRSKLCNFNGFLHPILLRYSGKGSWVELGVCSWPGEVEIRCYNAVRQSKGNVTREKWWVMSIWNFEKEGLWTWFVWDTGRSGGKRIETSGSRTARRSWRFEPPSCQLGIEPTNLIPSSSVLVVVAVVWVEVVIAKAVVLVAVGDREAPRIRSSCSVTVDQNSVVGIETR